MFYAEVKNVRDCRKLIYCKVKNFCVVEGIGGHKLRAHPTNSFLPTPKFFGRTEAQYYSVLVVLI